MSSSPVPVQPPFAVIRRDGDTPKVDLHDPLKPHRDMLRTYTDTEIHNLTSYLVTLK